MTTERKELTDAFVRSLAKAKPDKDRIICDELSPLRIKVRTSGTASYFVWARFGGAVTSATSRTIGRIDTIKLADAREKARDWVKLARAKDDPVRIERERQAQEAAERALTFDALLTEYAETVLVKQRRGRMVERELRRNFLPAWKGRPLKEITRGDVRKMIDKITARGCPYEARNAASGLRTMLNWAAERYDLETVPTDRMKLARLVGPTPPRQRVLTDDELFAFWRATARMGYPARQAYRLLLLTGARLNEIVGLRWSEVDLKRGLAIIPPKRFKSGTSHHVPLADEALAVLQGVPRWARGDAVFTRNGSLPTRLDDDEKKALDRRMLRTLKALARRRGEEPARVVLARWTNHDLRRTVRTRLSALRVDDHVAEMILGHGRRGLQRIYDLHSFEDEMREALGRWAKKLYHIVGEDPAPTDNVVKLKTA